MRYLLDTNVVSETFKRRPDPRVIAWLARDPETELSVLTLGELSRGAALLRVRDLERADRIDSWIRDLEERYADRIHVVDRAVMNCWATLPASRTLPVIDSLLAATALARGLVLATRNTKDLLDVGVELFNPFE